MIDHGEISIFYAPFDYVNEDAKVVICGITPGLQQALLAFREAKKQLELGKNDHEVLILAKRAGSFGGTMRTNLVRMLDHIGLNRKLAIRSCSQLFDSHSNLAHYTSILRYPVFNNGLNYNGTPLMLKNPILLDQIEKNLLQEIRFISRSAVYIPLGPKVTEAFDYLVAKGELYSNQVLNGIPHPSGANAERIAFFLGEKAQSDLSRKTKPDAIMTAKKKLLLKVARLNFT
jgi:hypothetical protein